ncbi:MAG: hypothetical protein ACXAC2_17870, partial [Candidatus Kariarchaeaceae archaeon]
MMSFFRIPSVIPRHRFVGAIIALTLSSAIFVGASTILWAMDKTGEDFFGTSDDVLVFYNEKATTPFTSHIPYSLVTSFETIPAVRVVSPEIFQPTVVNNHPIYIRGGIFSKITQLDNYELKDGRFPHVDQLFEVAVGSKLATRLNLQINTIITIESIIEEEHIPVFITGIFETSAITADEILTSLNVAATVAGYSHRDLTHIRVKYDPSVPRKEILEQGTRISELSIDMSIGNASSHIPHLMIWDILGTTVYEGAVTSFFTQKLLTGWYTINITQSSAIVYSNHVFINKNTHLSINFGNNAFNVDTQLLYHNHPLTGVRYALRNQSQHTVDSGFSDEAGEINQILPTGNYTFSFFEANKEYQHSFIVNGIVEQSFNIPIVTSINFRHLNNGSIIPRNTFRVQIENKPGDYQLILDDQYLEQDISDLSAEYYTITVGDGFHEFVVVRNQLSGEAITRVSFFVNSSIHLLNSFDLVEGGHYLPKTIVTIDAVALTSNITANTEQQLSVNYLGNYSSIELPQEQGFHTITLRAIDTTGTLVSRFIHI